MVPADNLHKLIKTMTGPEKRYFKLFASRQGSSEDKTYIQLFESIDSMKEYDEEVLKKKLPETFKLKNLPFQKHYLFTLIMQSLKNYSKGESFVNEILELLRDEEIYKQRGLVDLQERTILKAKELCYTYELFNVLITVLKSERMFYLQQIGKDPEAVIKRIFEEEKQVIEKMNTELNLVRLSNIIQVQYMVNPLFNDPVVFEKVNAIEKEMDVIDFESLTTYKSKESWYKVKTFLCRFRNDLHMDLYYQKQEILLLDQYPQLINNNHLILSYGNYLGACHRSGYYDEFEEMLQKISSIKAENLKQQEMLFSSITLYKLLYIMNVGKFDLKDEIVLEAEKGLAINKKLMKSTRIIAINYNLAVLNFICEDFSKCIDHCTEILDMKSDVRYDLQHGVWLMQLLCHFELGNDMIIESLLRSTQRFLQKNNVFEKFDKILVTAIRKMVNSPKNDRTEIFQELKTDLETLQTKNPNFKFVIMEEVLNWIKSRIKKISLVEQNLLQIAFKERIRKHTDLPSK